MYTALVFFSYIHFPFCASPKAFSAFRLRSHYINSLFQVCSRNILMRFLQFPFGLIIPPRKLKYHPKWTSSKGNFIFQPVILRGYISFRGSKRWCSWYFPRRNWWIGGYYSLPTSMMRPCRIEKAFLPVTGDLETCKMWIHINQIGVYGHYFNSSVIWNLYFLSPNISHISSKVAIKAFTSPQHPFTQTPPQRLGERPPSPWLFHRNGCVPPTLVNGKCLDQ